MLNDTLITSELDSQSSKTKTCCTKRICATMTIVTLAITSITFICLYIKVSSESTNTHQVIPGPGSQYWKLDYKITDDDLLNLPQLIDTDNVYVLNDDGVNYLVTAFDVDNGEKRWISIISKPYINSGFVLTNSNTLLIGATEINCDDGTHMGEYGNGGLSGFTQLSQDGNYIYLASDHGDIAYISKYSHFDYSTPIWRKSSYYAEFILSPDELVIYIIEQSEITARRANDWQQMWHITHGKTIILSSDGSIGYVFGNDNSIYAINTLDGSQIWKISPDSDVISRCTVSSNGMFLLVVTYGKVYNINTSDGSQEWVVNGNVITLSVDEKHAFIFSSKTQNDFCAINTIDGSQIWSFRIPEQDYVFILPIVSLNGGLVLVRYFPTNWQLQSIVSYRLLY